MPERLTDAAGYARLRAFLESEDLVARRLTAEWLAGRLGLPLRDCAAALDHLASDGVVRRRGRQDSGVYFELVPPGSAVGLRRYGLGATVLVVSVAVVVAGALAQHVFYFALGLGVGLMIAFAWLDWELRSRL